MATGKAVWGIDIGQSALKALKCRNHEDGFWMVAEAFDYVEYPSLLNQPGVSSEALIRDALREFLSRNDIRNDEIAISVAGQAGLARFFKAPPVEAKRLPDLVKWEAKQQIPFPLEDVIWDFQAMPGAHEEEGISLETEIGIFAMKRDQIFRALQPYTDVAIDLDVVQLAPISLYNFCAHDQLPSDPRKEEYDPDNQPESYVVVSMGTESTDLVITNGFRLWQRSLAIGGNHFTKQLTKELKLTFAKAEHLKRHASESENAKAVFQAMRPVFNDLVNEIQRSIGFFQTLDRKAKVAKIVPVGNGMKLPGLVPYLGKNLGYEVVELDGFNKLSGNEVTSAPAFRENMLSFCTCYGLCLQGLHRSPVRTNLLPQEILVERLVRRKKPWAVGAVAALLLACTASFILHWNAWKEVKVNEFSRALTQVESVSSQSSRFKGDDSSRQAKLDELALIGNYVVGNEENRRLWPELLKAITVALPTDPELAPGQVSRQPISERPDLQITSIDSEYFPDLSIWYTEEVKQKYSFTVESRNARIRKEEEAEGLVAPRSDEPQLDKEGNPIPTGGEENGNEESTGEDRSSEASADSIVEEESLTGDADAEVELAGPGEGSGWVIQLEGYHYHNRTRDNFGAQYVRNTLIDNLDRGFVELINSEGETELVSMKELGISHPFIAVDQVPRDTTIPNPDYEPPLEGILGEGGPAGGMGGIGRGGERGRLLIDPDAPQPTLKVREYRFTVQFCWRETPISQRIENRKAAEEAEADETNDFGDES
ncbi:MAG: type IV pilus assembly protein PilM [Pirellulaceae bacterium]